MKFDSSRYWKHRNCMDAFLEVYGITQQPDGVITLHANWMAQGLDGYWCAMPGSQFDVDPKDYENWEPYEPRGDVK